MYMYKCVEIVIRPNMFILISINYGSLVTCT